MTAPFDMQGMLGLLMNMKELEERKATRLQNAEFEKQRLANLAKELGLREDDARFNQTTRMLGVLAENAAKARGAITELAGTFGWKPEQVAAISQYALQAPETVAQLRNQAAQAGYEGATPQQRMQMNREAAFGATTGMNQGGAAESGLRAMLNMQGDQGAMDRLWSEGFQQALQTGNAVRQADPAGGAIQQSLLNTPGMARVAAGIQYGGELTAAQKGNLDVAGEGLILDRLRLSLQQAEQTARLKLAAGADAPTVVQIMSEMRQSAAQAANKEYAREVRDEAWKRYNSLERLLSGAAPSPGGTPQQAPQLPGLIDKYMAEYRMEAPLPNAPLPSGPAAPSPFMPRTPYTPRIP